MQAIIASLLPTVLPYIAGPLIAWLAAKALWGVNRIFDMLRSKAAGTKAAAYGDTIEVLQQLATVIVQGLEQTAVAAAKKNGTWNAEAAKQIGARALELLKAQAGPLLAVLASQGLKDTQSLLQHLIEGAVLTSTGTPGEASGGDFSPKPVAPPTEDRSGTTFITGTGPLEEVGGG